MLFDGEPLKPTKVPPNILIPILNKAGRQFKGCTDTWTEAEYDLIRFWLPEEWSTVPRDLLRKQAINLRKDNQLESVKGHAPGKLSLSPELQEYYNSDHWKHLRQRVLEHWGNRCAICYHAGGLEVHHRTYHRLHHESMTDLIPVCGQCHRMADDRRRREFKQHGEQLVLGAPA